MERTEAQKRADKRYSEKIKGKHKQFSVNLKVEEYQTLENILDGLGLSKADFLRWAVEEIQKNK